MNKRQFLAGVAGVLSLVTGIFAVRIIWFSPEVAPDLPEPEMHELPALGKRLSGPYTHKNLSIYLIHGEDTLTGRAPLTLEEAMNRNVVIVHETGDVNELAIENVSPKDEVFVQAGDIVKGGKQDRVLAVDLIVPARSGRMPIDSFCVEQGRWTARGVESSSNFGSGSGSGSGYIASKDLKVATKVKKVQADVWAGVSGAQEKLSAATNTNAASNLSRSSLPLTLENKAVRENSDSYVKALSAIVEGKSDAVGFLFTINGEINSADTYGSAALFAKLWPKLLKATAIEAVAESNEYGESVVASIADIESFIASAENAPVTEERTITSRVRLVTRESKTSVLLTSSDRGSLLHRNYILK